MSAHVDESLFELALGTVASGERERVEGHLKTCRECATQLLEVREIVAALALGLDAVPSPPAARAQLLSAIAPRGRWAAFVAKTAALLDIASDKARAILDGIDDPASWQAGLFPSGSLYHVDGGPRVAAAICGFIRMPDGAHFPPHKHLGDESVLILAGACRDDDGAIYRAGDIVRKPAGSTHEFDALGELTYLAILEGGLEMNGQVYTASDTRL